MGFFADLSRLRPLMTLADVRRILALDCKPGEGGWLVVPHCAIRIDARGRIGEITFDDGFPSNHAIEGLTIGTTLDALMQSPLGFRQAPKRAPPFVFTPYEAALESGDRIVAVVGPNGWTRRIEVSRPGLVYAEGRRWSAKQIRVNVAADTADLSPDWAGAATFSANYPTFQAIAHWLQHEADPDGWHHFVFHHNWDHGLDPLLWVIRQPACDKATALLAFYMSRPGEFVKYDGDRSVAPGHALEAFDLIEEIRQRFLGGFYGRSQLAFDGPRALAEEAYLPRDVDPAALDRVIPPAMRESIGGRVVDLRPEKTRLQRSFRIAASSRGVSRRR